RSSRALLQFLPAPHRNGSEVESRCPRNRRPGLTACGQPPESIHQSRGEAYPPSCDGGRAVAAWPWPRAAVTRNGIEADGPGRPRLREAEPPLVPIRPEERRKPRIAGVGLPGVRPEAEEIQRGKLLVARARFAEKIPSAFGVRRAQRGYEGIGPRELVEKV